jgi:hypothetical protein
MSHSERSVGTVNKTKTNNFASCPAQPFFHYVNLSPQALFEPAELAPVRT